MIYREMREGDEQAVSRLIQESFHRYIAHTYTSEGVDNFLEETSPWGIAERKRKGQLIIVAEEGKGKGNRVIVGVIVVRSGNHISLFAKNQGDRSWRQLHNRQLISLCGRFLRKDGVSSYQPRAVQEGHAHQPHDAASTIAGELSYCFECLFKNQEIQVLSFTGALLSFVT